MNFLRQSLIAASIITIAANMISRLLGFFREAVIANYFGTSEMMDIFIIAFTVPEVVAMVVYTALPASLIPYIINSKQTNDNSEFRGFWTGFFMFLTISSIITFSLLSARNVIINTIAPRLTEDGYALAYYIITVSSFYVFFRILESYFRAWLHAKKHYVIPSLSNIILNLIILAIVYLIYEKVYVQSLAVGWLVGSFILLAMNSIMLLKIMRKNIIGSMDTAWAAGLIKIFFLIVLVESISLSFPLVDRFLAARYLETGIISGLRYALLLMIIPASIFAISYNTVSLPWISDLIKSGDKFAINQFYSKSVSILFYTIGISAMGFLLFSDEIVQVAFKRGQYDIYSSFLTAGPLRYYAVGIVFYSLYVFQMRFYYATKKIVRLALILVVMTCLKILSSLILIQYMGQKGLALSTSLMWIAGFLIMTIDLTVSFQIRFIFFKDILKIVLNLFIAGLIWFILKSFWNINTSIDLLTGVLQLAFIGATGICVYVIFGKIMNVEIQSRCIKIILSIFKGSEVKRL